MNPKDQSARLIDNRTFVRTCDCFNTRSAGCSVAARFSGNRPQECNDLLPERREVVKCFTTPASFNDQPGQMKPLNMLTNGLDVGPTGRGDLRQ